MSNLRRHDWRSHRDVKCAICDDRIESRQEIGNHRQSKHQIFKKTFCRFYPECLDGDECLFSHEQENKSLNGSQLCPRGPTCSVHLLKQIIEMLITFYASFNLSVPENSVLFNILWQEQLF